MFEPFFMVDQARTSSRSGGEFKSHSVTLDAETGEIVNMRTVGVGSPDHPIQDISEASAKSIALDFIEKNELAKGTSIEEINMYNFAGKAYLAKLKLANGQRAALVVNRLTGSVDGYEGDVEDSVYNVDKINTTKNPDTQPSATILR